MLTKRCKWCNPPHIVGEYRGDKFTDGLCWKAELRESIKLFLNYELPAFFRDQVAPGLRVAEVWLTRLAVAYFLAHMAWWGFNNFSVVG